METKKAVDPPATIDGVVLLMQGLGPDDRQAQIAYMSEDDLSPGFKWGRGLKFDGLSYPRASTEAR
jgi:hypothetical protein